MTDQNGGHGNQSHYRYRPPQPGYPYGYTPEHPQATAVLVLGIVGIFTGICAFIAWYMGSQALKEIQAGAPYTSAGNLRTGYTLGKVFSLIYIITIGLAVVFPLVMALSGMLFAGLAGSRG